MRISSSNISNSFDVAFKIANIGEKNLKNSYITYIYFKGNYLWCKKFIISNNLERNDSFEVKLKIKFKEKNNIENGLFEGYFRMFNPNDIPFGDILKVRVENGKK